MAESFTKITDKLARDVKTGILSANEYLLLVYMLQNADKKTGIIEISSRLLSIELNLDRVRVRNILTSLKSKNRLQTPDGDKTENLQKRGSTRPYSIRLCDALPIGQLDRDKTETRQRQDRGSDRGSDRGQEVETSQSGETIEFNGDFGKNEGDTDKIRSEIKDKDSSPRQQQTNYIPPLDEDTAGSQKVVASEEEDFLISREEEEDRAAIGGMVANIAIAEGKSQNDSRITKAVHRLVEKHGIPYLAIRVTMMLEAHSQNKVKRPLAWVISACVGNWQPNENHDYESKWINIPAAAIENDEEAADEASVE